MMSIILKNNIVRFCPLGDSGGWGGGRGRRIIDAFVLGRYLVFLWPSLLPSLVIFPCPMCLVFGSPSPIDEILNYCIIIVDSTLQAFVKIYEVNPLCIPQVRQ